MKVTSSKNEMKNPINIKAIPKFLLYFGATVCVIFFLSSTMHLIKENCVDQSELYATEIGFALLILFFVFKIMGEPLNEIVKKEE